MTEYVTLAGGCFWCTEAVFKDVIGVESVESGYIGGTLPHPTYKQVCGGDTGHAEAIRIPSSYRWTICSTFTSRRTTRRNSTARAMTWARSTARRCSRRTRRRRRR